MHERGVGGGGRSVQRADVSGGKGAPYIPERSVRGQWDLYCRMGPGSAHRRKARCLASSGEVEGAQKEPLTCMVTTPSSSAASLRIWLASTCASSRMEKSASATEHSSQHAPRQSSQRDGRRARAPAGPDEPRQPRARAAAPAVSSSSGSRAMLPPPTPRRQAPGAGKRGGSNGRCAQGPLGAPRKTFLPFFRLLREPRRLPNLGGARLQRASASGHHRRALAAGWRGSAARALPGTPAPARPPQRGAAGVSEGGGARTRRAGRGADSRSGEPPSFRFPGVRRGEAEAARAGGGTGGGGAAPELRGWAATRARRERGRFKKNKTKHQKTLRERKKESGGGKGRRLVPPRCTPAPCTSRRGRSRGCGDLWKEGERRGNSPSRPSSLSLAPASEPAPQRPGAGEPALFSGTSLAGGGVTRTFLWPGTATHPSSHCHRHCDGLRDPARSRFYPMSLYVLGRRLSAWQSLGRRRPPFVCPLLLFGVINNNHSTDQQVSFINQLLCARHCALGVVYVSL